MLKLIRKQSAAPIEEQELLFQGFGMDHPIGEPCNNDFSDNMMQSASDALKYSREIDFNHGITILTDQLGMMSRDVAVTYKTLLYRAICNSDANRRSLRLYKELSLALAVGFGVMTYLMLFHHK